MTCVISRTLFRHSYFCRRAISICLMAMLVLCLHTAGASAGPNLVFDVKTGDVLYSRNAGDKWYPASLTKMMTAYLTFKAIDQKLLTLKTKLIVSKNASRQPPSKIGLPPGAKISVDKALEVLIVRSANDIAVVLAEGVSGTEKDFIKAMNDWAKSLGMTATSFGNPHGLEHKRQITSARDMGILARKIILEYPQYQHYFEGKSVKVGKRTLATRNKLLKTLEGADGMKTGFICNSGFNIVASATRNGRRLIAVVLGAKSTKVRNDRAAQLLDWAFAQPRPGILDNVGITSTITLAKLSNGLLLNKPKSMRNVVCKPRKKRAKKKKKRSKSAKKKRAKKKT